MLKKGFIWGVVATVPMTIVMKLAMAAGIAPMPEPIPTALVKVFLGDLGAPVTTIVAMIAHFGYGGVGGAVFGQLLEDKLSLAWGFRWGAILWLVMQLAVLPIVGWGFFGFEVTGFPPKIAVGTLVLHLIYGGTLGWGMNR